MWKTSRFGKMEIRYSDLHSRVLHGNWVRVLQLLVCLFFDFLLSSTYYSFLKSLQLILHSHIHYLLWDFRITIPFTTSAVGIALQYLSVPYLRLRMESNSVESECLKPLFLSPTLNVAFRTRRKKQTYLCIRYVVIIVLKILRWSYHML